MTDAAAALIRRFGPVVLLLLLLAALIASGLMNHLTLSDLRAHRAELTSDVAAHPVLSLAVFVGLYVIVVVSCAPGPGVLAMAGGFLFGTWIGGAASMVACVTGSSLLFLACRSALGDVILRRAGRTIRRMEAHFSRGAFGYLLTLRLIPAVPFFVPTVAAAAARTRLSTLALATLIGTTPSMLILASLGRGLGVIFERDGPIDVRLLQTPHVILPLVGLAVLGIAPIAWRLLRGRRRED